MSDDIRQQADARTAAALDALALRDPRDHFREWLKSLRDKDPAAFAEARDYFDRTLLPRLTEEAADPVLEWIAYGRFLAERGGPGEVVAIDADGRASPYADLARGILVLFLPGDPARRALILNLPRQPTPAQRAACDLLALGKTILAEKGVGL